jgi:hypothetical protein
VSRELIAGSPVSGRGGTSSDTGAAPADVSWRTMRGPQPWHAASCLGVALAPGRPFAGPGPVIALALQPIELRQRMAADAAIVIASLCMASSHHRDDITASCGEVNDPAAWLSGKGGAMPGAMSRALTGDFSAEVRPKQKAA